MDNNPSPTPTRPRRAAQKISYVTNFDLEESDEEMEEVEEVVVVEPKKRGRPPRDPPTLFKKPKSQDEVRKEPVKVMYRPEDENNTFHCHVCDTYWPTKDKRNRHLFAHSHEYESKCCFCGKLIKHRNNLKHHLSACREKALAMDADNGIARLFPEFAGALEAASKDVTLPLPTLPPGFRMDRNGFVTGFVPNLSTGMDMFSR